MALRQIAQTNRIGFGLLLVLFTGSVGKSLQQKPHPVCQMADGSAELQTGGAVLWNLAMAHSC
jgi:hypothetical protein